MNRDLLSSTRCSAGSFDRFARNDHLVDLDIGEVSFDLPGNDLEMIQSFHQEGSWDLDI
jgi:hypothetical protein